MQTYHFKGHSVDPRSTGPKKGSTKPRPNWSPEQVLKTQRDVTDADMETIYDAKEDCARAVEFSENAPAPDLDELYKDVYVERFGPWTGLPKMLANDPSYNGCR